MIGSGHSNLHFTTHDTRKLRLTEDFEMLRLTCDFKTLHVTPARCNYLKSGVRRPPDASQTLCFEIRHQTQDCKLMRQTLFSVTMCQMSSYVTVIHVWD